MYVIYQMKYIIKRKNLMWNMLDISQKLILTPIKKHVTFVQTESGHFLDLL